MNDFKEVAKGRIVSRDAGQPVQGARVRVYDKDLVFHDHLGDATTGEGGRFEVEYHWSDYKDGVFEGRPDIFVKVTNPSTGKTTKSRVFEELEGDLADDDSVEVMDLGDIPVD